MAFPFYRTHCIGQAVDLKIPSDVFLVLFSFEFTFACGSFIPVTMIEGEMVQGSASPYWVFIRTGLVGYQRQQVDHVLPAHGEMRLGLYS